MPLSPEFEAFYSSWIEKAPAPQEVGLRSLFDTFFTLFVVYNRLYAETTFLLARKNEINISKRTNFPDGEAAKTYVLKYLGSLSFMQQIERSTEAVGAIESIKNLLRTGAFNIKLHMVTGDRQPEKDLALLQELESRNTNTKAKAILDMLYSIRCNMFHGHKGFHEVQSDLLRPVVILLREVVGILHSKLQQDEE